MEKVGQDAVFLASETELAVGDENLERLRQQSDVAQPDIHLAGLSAAADDTADARMQFGQVEGFSQIVVGAKLQPGHLVVRRVARRDDDHALALLHRLEALQKGEAATVGQHDVEQDAIVVVVLDLVERRAKVVGRFNHGALTVGERLGDQFAQ